MCAIYVFLERLALAFILPLPAMNVHTYPMDIWDGRLAFPRIALVSDELAVRAARG